MATSTTIHLDGPEVWHVMLHHHRDQRAIAVHIQVYLQRWKLKCCLVDVNSDKQSTENYCWRSRVIIPIISKDYITRSVETGSWAIIQDKLEVLGQIGRAVVLNSTSSPITDPQFEGLEVLEYISNDIMAEILVVATREEFDYIPEAAAESSSTGATLAWSYYYGFLHLVMPKWGASGMDIQERIRKCHYWHSGADQRIISQKIIIIILESCKCPPNVSALNENIKRSDHWLNCAAHRSGHPEREYRVPIFSIDVTSRRPLYAAADMPTVVLALYEMAEDPHCKFTTHQKTIEVSKFYHTLHRILIHSGLNLEKKYSIVYIKDEVNEDVKQLLINRIEKEILKDIKREHDYGIQIDLARQPEHHQVVPLSSTAPTSQARRSPQYIMSRRPRGIALIINIYTFRRMRSRQGATQDALKLDNLMKKLEFDVYYYENTDKETLMSVFSEFSDRDHSRYDCFVCFLLTHGKKGYVYGSDERSLAIIEITELFYPARCPSLKDKPKVFFIQACQDDGESNLDSSEAASTPPSAYGAASAQSQRVGLHEVTPTGASLPSGPSGPSSSPPIQDLNVVDVPEEQAGDPSTSLSFTDIESLYGDGKVKEDAGGFSEGTDKSLYVPDEEDFLMGYATLPGRKAFRDTVTGSVYITILAEEMGKVDSGLDILSMLDSTRDKVKKVLHDRRRQRPTGKIDSQVPFYLPTLSKRLCFDLQTYM